MPDQLPPELSGGGRVDARAVGAVRLKRVQSDSTLSAGTPTDDLHPQPATRPRPARSPLRRVPDRVDQRTSEVYPVLLDLLGAP